jgi:hypothetical protein
MVNNSSRVVKYDYVNANGDCETASQQDPGCDYDEQTYFGTAWVFRDAATGVVHAVFQQFTDYNGKAHNKITVNEDSNGNLFLNYDTVPEAPEIEEFPEEATVV